MPTLANLLLRPSRGPAMHDSRPGDGSERTSVHYTMKASSRPSPSSDGPLPRSDSHSPRASKSAKAATTPSLSSRPSCSLAQNNIPMRSPTRHIEVRAPSPNYFGLSFESVADSRDSPSFSREPWGQASPLAKSFSPAASKHPPPPEPIVENAEFEAFRRQVDQSRAKSFSLPPSLLSPSTHPTPSRPRPPRWHTHATDTSRCVTSNQRPATTATSMTCTNPDASSADAPVAAARGPDSESPMPSSHSADSPSRLHPTPSNSFTPLRPTISTADDGHFELSSSTRDADSSPGLPEMRRAVTLPSPCEHRSLPMISGPHLKNLIENSDDYRLLLLDIRSSQNHAQSRIRGALNLCIPTTLLKRPNFNTQKLQQTFQGGSCWEKFSRWRDVNWIVVYDAHGSAKGDAIAAQNMVKKFTNEGYSGNIAILRGGFEAFQNVFPELVDDGPPSPADGQPPSPMCSNGVVAPVIGGVSLPTCANRPSPFFSNIRQNMDLADGVGQLEVSLPQGLELQSLPQWLQVAASKSDHGKSVSDKFLRIELEEQSRMRNAYAAFDPKANPDCRFQLSGVEKGGKNRYKDILPFEHARVKLQKESDSSCDYVNASHLQPSGSKKRYIATQGPLPETFEDFWSVVWQQDVRVIVMLTAQSEGGQLKCHAYWEGCHFGTFRLKLLSKRTVSLATGKHRPDSRSATLTSAVEDAGSVIGAGTGMVAESSSVAPAPAAPAAPAAQEVSDAPHVVIRKFGLSHASKPSAPMREIAHLHFPDWPDFGTPAQPSHLLALVEMANATQRTALSMEMGSIADPDPPWADGSWEALANGSEVDEGTRPMLVHCSAGCGRTGTFCTVDSVIDMMKRQRRAKMAEPRPVDGQGDVSMAEYDDVMSPRAGQQITAANHSQEEEGKGKTETDAWVPLDLQFPWLFDDSIDLVQRTVAEFREQRLSMVQSLRQYVLCYETILEWIYLRQDRTTSGKHGDQPTSGLGQPGQGSNQAKYA